MTPRLRSAVRAVLAGVALGAGVGLGAHNGWLMALLAGVPLLATAVVLSPRPTRIDGLRPWTPSRPGTEVRIDALTRSSLGAPVRQPVMVSATVQPPDDTPYEARWLASMTRTEFESVLASPRQEIATIHAPPRDQETIPGFDDVPGRAASVFPVITAVVAAVVVLAIPAQTWHVDVDLSSMADSLSPSPSTDSIAEPADRLDALRRHALTLTPEAGSTVLSLDLDADGNDRVDVLAPATGEVVSASYSATSRRWLEPHVHASAKRRPDTFPVSDLDGFDAGAVVATMRSRLPAGQRNLLSLTIARPRQGEKPLVTASLGADVFSDMDLQARLTGEVAEVFDPADLATSLPIATRVMRSEGLRFDEPVLTRVEIRGTRPGTPIMRAGSIQNSGGILVEYTTLERTAGITVVPGSFPATVSSYENSSRALRDGAFAPDRLSPEVFARVRDDAMRRGAVEQFDRAAIDISANLGGYRDDYGPVIWVAVGPGSASEGTYGLDGTFLRPGIS